MKTGSEKLDIHDRRHRFELALRNLRQDPVICQENKNLIQRFLGFCRAQSLSMDRQLLYLLKLTVLARLHKAPFDQASRDSIVNMMEQVKKRGMAEWTYQTYCVTVKKFYKWLRASSDCPPEVKWIRTTVKNKTTITAEKLLSEEEVLKLVEKAENHRDRAFVLVLYESGCRIGEILGLRIRDIAFDEYGALLSVTGKTGHRRIRIVASCSELTAWLNVHPKSKDRDALVWIGIGTVGRNDPLTYPAARSMLKRLAKRAGLKKRIHPHLLRHSRATGLLKKDYSLSKLPALMGWTPGTKMLNIYSHLNGEDADEEILRLHGLAAKSKSNPDLTVRICPRCQEKVSSASKFCQRCGSPMNPDEWILEEKREAADKLLNLLLDDPEVRGLVSKKLGKLGREQFQASAEKLIGEET